MVLMLILGMGAVLQIWVINRMSTFGEQITRIEMLKGDLKMENQLLENSIAEKSTLAKLKLYANHLGFDAVKNIQYIQQARSASIK